MSYKNPYQELPPNAFWKSGVATLDPLEISGLATPKFRLTKKTQVGTAGSCFAQHISRYLRSNGFSFVDVEPPPPFLEPKRQPEFGYGMYSARYGNIYTAAQLRQLVQRASGRFEPEEKAWENQGRFYDPFRPTIEPRGFASAEELALNTASHLESVRRLFSKMDVFIFTLGLTEAWRSKSDGAVYPMCPGTHAGSYDPSKYEFVNFSFSEILNDLTKTFTMLRKRNTKLRFLLTVSPVPLTATASGQHVLTATTYSKSVLRSVAGQLRDQNPDVDYFPSYEMITAPAFGGRFYEENLRGIRSEGVEFVMNTFLREFCELEGTPHATAKRAARRAAGPRKRQDDVWCDEQVLEFYGDK